jgi:signal transduction histidine kinase
MGRPWQLARRYGFDALIVFVALWSALEVGLRDDAADAPRTSAWFTITAVALVPLPLLARRRLPFAAPALVWLACAAISFVDGRLAVFSEATFLAGCAATFLLGNLRDARQSWTGLAVSICSVTIIIYNNPGHAPGELVFVPVLFAIVWLTGFALRERSVAAEAAEARAAQAEREREAAARLAVAEERARIARELHDVVAHSVSVMVLQVGAIRHRLPAALADDADALRGVEQTGRSALAEMRRLLGAMRDEGDGVELEPQPGLDRLDALLEEVGRAGLPVSLHVDGEPAPLPRALDLSAYRIVQEGLTNALKHARASRADVTLSYSPAELRIEVRDDGAGGAGGEAGYGLVGIGERVKIYGGEMSAGRANGGGFVLSTRLPLGAER